MDNWEKLPIFKKAMEIQKLIDHIVESVENSEIEFKNEFEADMISGKRTDYRYAWYSNAWFSRYRIFGFTAQ